MGREHVGTAVGLVQAEHGRGSRTSACDAGHRQALAHGEHGAGHAIDAADPVTHLAAPAATELPAPSGPRAGRFSRISIGYQASRISMSTKSTMLCVPTPTTPRSPPSRSMPAAEPPKKPSATTQPSMPPSVGAVRPRVARHARRGTGRGRAAVSQLGAVAARAISRHCTARPLVLNDTSMCADAIGAGTTESMIVPGSATTEMGRKMPSAEREVLGQMVAKLSHDLAVHDVRL